MTDEIFPDDAIGPPAEQQWSMVDDPLVRAILKQFPGARIISPEERAANPITFTELLYTPGEAQFGVSAIQMCERGWGVFPQERDGRRMPAKVDGGRTLKWGQYHDVGPKLVDVTRWSMQVAAANTAIILGPPSGNVFCFDIDVTDAKLAFAVRDVAAEILGPTPFERVGTAPKIALFYRSESAETLPPYRRYQFVGTDGVTPAEDAIEILGKGRAITAIGHHHMTGRYFTWLHKNPVRHGPEHAPIISAEKIAEFIDRVQELRAFTSRSRPGGPVETYDGELTVSTDGWVLPPTPADRLTDGREGELHKAAFWIVRHNPERVAVRAGDSWLWNAAGAAAAVEVVVSWAEQAFAADGRWSRGSLRQEVRDRVTRAARMLCAGEIEHLPRVRRSGGKAVVSKRVTLAPSVATDPALWHLPPRDKRRALDLLRVTAPDPEKAAARALRTDRTETAAKVALQLTTAFGSFVETVYSVDAEAKTVHVIKAPTGAGKTTRLIRYIAEDARTFTQAHGSDGGDVPVGPFLFLLPTYQNISEVRARAQQLNLDPRLSDANLAEQAEELGIMSVEEARREMDRLRLEAKNAGLETMIYKGKIAAGCQFASKVDVLQKAGISTSGLCQAKVFDKLTGETSEEQCVFYHSCPAIQQRKKIAASHIVFLPHAFMTLAIPEELKNVRAVIADERIFPLFVHVSQFELSVLSSARKEPSLTKKERELGVDPLEFFDDRRHAVEVALRAIGAGRCPAAELAGYSLQQPKRTVTGAELAAAAARVCGSAAHTNVVVHPSIADHELAALCTTPTGTSVREEYRFWKIIQERIEAIQDGTAKHDRDLRIQRRLQPLGDTAIPMIRISWRSEANWPAAPVLLLDASAHQDIVGKVFPGRTVVMHEIEADLNLRVVAVIDGRKATSSLVVSEEASLVARAKAARSIDTLRDVRTALAAVHADGRVLGVQMKSVRELLNRNYSSPGNLDDIHAGAERGLNFAERHVASIGIGRMELPVWQYDGFAAALGHDDDEAPALLDPYGTGCDANGEALKPVLGEVVIPRRDGSDVTIVTAVNPAGWLRIVQEQFREEALRQGPLGRLRPVYREDTPTAYLLCQSIPDGIIVDEFCSTADLIPSYVPLLEAARYNGGVIDPFLARVTRPDVATPEDFREQFRALPKALKSKYHALSYRSGGRTLFCGVPGYVADPVPKLVTELSRAGIEVDAEPEIVRRTETKAPAAERPIDELERSFGSHDERRELELFEVSAACNGLIDENAYLPGQRSYAVAGTAGADRGEIHLSLQAHALLSARAYMVEETAEEAIAASA